MARERLSDKPCFSGVGIDYTGALSSGNIFVSDIVQKDEPFKCYIVTYTCSATRGIVLDLVPDAPAQTFTLSLKRFVSQRGFPQVRLYDNGSPFIANSVQECGIAEVTSSVKQIVVLKINLGKSLFYWKSN